MVSAVQSTTTVLRGAAGPGVARPTLRVWQALGQRPDPRSPAVAREAAAQFAADLFLTPLLAEVRRFPLGGEVGDGGPGEAVFGQQLDQRIADQVAAKQPGLVDAILRSFQGVRGGSAARGGAT
ncbi:MAG: hypothetical protein AB1601_06090 [Planctomycetota bacterium]